MSLVHTGGRVIVAGRLQHLYRVMCIEYYVESICISSSSHRQNASQILVFLTELAIRSLTLESTSMSENTPTCDSQSSWVLWE